MTFRLGDYQAVEQLGVGGSTQVWRGVGISTGAVVAMKVSAAGQLAVARREAALTSAVDHPHVLAVLEVVSDQDRVAVITEFAAGGDLTELLARRGRLSPGETLTVLIPVAAALATAHERDLVHGDVSARHIVFDRAGRPMLADLGAGRAGAESGLPVSATARDAAPELARGGQPTPATDLFGLGSLALCCLTGRHAWPADEIGDVLIQAAAGQWPDPGDEAGPPGLVAVIRAMLEHDPERRPGGASVVLDLRASGRPQPIDFGLTSRAGDGPDAGRPARPAVTSARAAVPGVPRAPAVGGRHLWRGRDTHPTPEQASHDHPTSDVSTSQPAGSPDGIGGRVVADPAVPSRPASGATDGLRLSRTRAATRGWLVSTRPAEGDRPAERDRRADPAGLGLGRSGSSRRGRQRRTTVLAGPADDLAPSSRGAHDGSATQSSGGALRVGLIVLTCLCVMVLAGAAGLSWARWDRSDPVAVEQVAMAGHAPPGQHASGRQSAGPDSAGPAPSGLAPAAPATARLPAPSIPPGPVPALATPATPSPLASIPATAAHGATPASSSGASDAATGRNPRTGVPTDWTTTVRALDVARARALVTRDVGLLDSVYTADSPARAADVHIIATLTAGGLRLSGAEHQVQGTRPLGRSPIRVVVDDSLPSYVVLDAAGEVVDRTVARPRASRVLVLVETAAGFRISRILTT